MKSSNFGSKVNMAKSSKKPDTPEALITHIQESCRESGPYVFRGTNRKFDKISSSIYRDFPVNFNEKFWPVDIEEEIVARARGHFSPSISNVEILTDLRHFGGDTTLIDFSHDLFVALYFACNPEIQEDGELIAFSSGSHRREKDVKYYEKHDERRGHIVFLDSARTQLSRARVEYQSSIFVHAPKGVIPKCYCKFFSVPKELKKEMSDHLRDFHNITEDTIYNDLFGFIQNERNLKKVRFWFYQGLAEAQKKKYRKAINSYDNSIQLKPDYMKAYNNRGNAKVALRCHEEALADYDKAIRLKPDSAETYSNRGLLNAELGFYEKALMDYNESIRLKPDSAESYYNRGNAKADLGCHNEALADYDEAIRLRSDDAETYHNRGHLKAKLGRHKEALVDYDEAIRLKPDYARAYFNRGIVNKNLGRIEEAQKDFEEAWCLANKQGNQKAANEVQQELSKLGN